MGRRRSKSTRQRLFQIILSLMHVASITFLLYQFFRFSNFLFCVMAIKVFYTVYSSSLQVICEICAETKETTQMIKNNTCDHSYCSDCMTKYVATKIQDNITVVPCPGLDCETVYELEACRPWLPKDLIERWDIALWEYRFLQVPKFYCPFKDCSAMIVVENEEDEQYAGETECHVCHRMFCATCKVPWHPGVDCEEYQILNENERQREDLLLEKLADEENWGRCPECKIYVEKINGCPHIICRCSCHFCYECGEKWTIGHAILELCL